MAAGWRRGAFIWRYRIAFARGAALLLIVLVILQNLEPTSLDLLFWSLPSVPKLVLIIASMALGAGLWELVRRLLLTSRG